MNQEIAKKEVTEIIEHIKQVDPELNKIDINLEDGPEGTFKSKIEVRAYRRKFIAKKVGSSITSSLNKASQAIIKQLGKIKEKTRQKRRMFFRKVNSL